jgi:hypothetical protein
MRKVLIIAIGLMSVCVSLETATAAKFERWWPPGFVTTWAPPQLRAIMKIDRDGQQSSGNPPLSYHDEEEVARKDPWSVDFMPMLEPTPPQSFGDSQTNSA